MASTMSTCSVVPFWGNSAGAPGFSVQVTVTGTFTTQLLAEAWPCPRDTVRVAAPNWPPPVVAAPAVAGNAAMTLMAAASAAIRMTE